MVIDMSDFLASPVFCTALTVLAYLAGFAIREKTPLKAPPILTASILIAILLYAAAVPPAAYRQGTVALEFFIAPAVAVMAVPIYRQRGLIRRNFAAIMLGCLAGSLTSLVSIWLMCRAFGLSEAFTASLLPKSVTTPIAVEISAMLGGEPGISTMAVMISGVMGALMAPWLLKIIHVKSHMAGGVAIGASSHAVGTSRAVEMGEEYGACSSAAMGICGVMTTLLAVAMSYFI